MLRYHLDDLGWSQFESLIQALLKLHLGLNVESWGQRYDHGRDSYCESALRFPRQDALTEGPFVFQMKFVEGASAAGAQPGPLLLKAVRAECERIQTRIARDIRAHPAQYVLVTNVNLDAPLREAIDEALRGRVSSDGVVSLGGSDVCDLLDAHPQLRRAYPQLLGLRDLDSLLREVVNADVIQRSRSALECARDLFEVFVPTAPYERAWRTLREHSFAVLEGPPEMGKSAIAWVVGVALLSEGWEAIVCDEPQDFFRCYLPDSRQVFIADDAFGLTEYDPARGSKWEKNLDRVLHRIDGRHWLIWTTRKHILERARHRLDLQGRASAFPKPGDILVNASGLSLRDKALILYRHLRAANLTETERLLLRKLLTKSCELFLRSAHFTPERIRRFATERLPDLRKASGVTLDEQMLQAELLSAIQHPTSRMRKAFAALPIAHKWALIALLEGGPWPSADEVALLYDRRSGVHGGEAFGSVIEELSEAFVKLGHQRIQWIHPSYRDLVIEELCADIDLRRAFLRTASLEGVKLALSEAGGAEGKRRLPLVAGDEERTIVSARCNEMVKTGDRGDEISVLNTLHAIVSARQSEEWLTTLAGSVCNAVREKWDREDIALGCHALRVFCRLSVCADPLPSMPQLEASWSMAEGQVYEALASDSPQLDVPGALEELSELAEIIAECEPRFLKRKEYPFRYRAEIGRARQVAGTMLDPEVDDVPGEEARGEAERAAVVARAFRRLNGAGLSEELPENFIAEVEKRAAALEQRADEANREEESDPFADDAREADENVGGIFTDL